MYSSFPPTTPIPIALSGFPMDMVGKVQAGFPSPAEDFAVKRIDLNAELITHPQATFVMIAKGVSMEEFGISDGDMLLVNKALKPRHDHIVIAVVDGEFTVKKLFMLNGRILLRAGNRTYPDIVPKDGQTLEVWGVVTWCLKRFLA